jgi:hypothetical protein
MASQEGVKTKELRSFEGVNTQASRIAIGDDEFAWLENMMPVGHGNMRAVPAISAVKATLTGESVYYWKDANIAGIDYMFCFCTSGAAYQINLVGYTVVKFANAGTFSAAGVSMCQWKNERILIIDPSNGYFDWNVVTLTTIAAGTKGTSIASYSGRVWIGNGRTVTFTDVLSYTSFAGAAGAITISDEYLHSSVISLTVANNFLYIFGVNSVNVVGDVRVVGGITLFSNTNITAQVGTNIPASITIKDRAIYFANQFGIYAMRGANPVKESQKIDGTITLIDFTGPITAATGIIYNQNCSAFLFTYLDPLLGSRPLMAVILHRGRSDPIWFFVSQSSSLTMIGSAQVGGSPKILATDGSNIYELFADTTSSISTKTATKLWDMGTPILDKVALKAGVAATIPSGGLALNVVVDNETQVSNPATSFSTNNVVSWINNTATVVLWTNNGAQIVNWTASGYAFLMSNVENVGKYLGLTMTSTSAGYILNASMIDYKLGARW